MPFVVVRQAVAATMDMGVGHAGLVKLCRFMDMEPLQHKSYSRHVKAVTAANMTVVSSLFDDAAKLCVRCTESVTHIFSKPNDEQYISMERQSTIEALHELL